MDDSKQYNTMTDADRYTLAQNRMFERYEPLWNLLIADPVLPEAEYAPARALPGLLLQDLVLVSKMTQVERSNWIRLHHAISLPEMIQLYDYALECVRDEDAWYATGDDLI